MIVGAMLSFVIALAMTPALIQVLRSRGIGQPIHDDMALNRDTTYPHPTWLYCQVLAEAGDLAQVTLMYSTESEDGTSSFWVSADQLDE